jgi:hypothetical protein
MMKKLLTILMLISITAFSMAQDKTGNIRAGTNSLAWPMTFTAADSIAGKGKFHIVQSDSLVILITNIQKYMQNQTVSTTILKNSGTPSVVVTLRGRITSTDSWHPIGTPVTWTTTANNPVVITSTSPVNYNYLKVSYVASGTTQCVRVTAFDIRTSNAYDVSTSAGTVTFSRPTSGTVTLTSKDNDANAALTVTPGGTGALTLGNGTGTVAVNSSDWDISTTGAMTGIGAITADGLITGTLGTTITGAAVNLNASSNFATNIGTGTSNALVTIGGGSGTIALNSSVWGITAAGVASGLTGLTTSGVITGGSLVVGVDTCKGVRTTGKSVAGLGLLRVTAACTLQGLVGGVTGQLLRIINTSNTTLVIKHNGSGTQKFMISGAGDLTLTGQYNALTLIFDGTNWYVTGKGQ